LKTLTVGVHTASFNTKRNMFLATQRIYVFLRILKSNSDYFRIHQWLIGLSDGNAVSSARYELRLYMYM